MTHRNFTRRTLMGGAAVAATLVGLLPSTPAEADPQSDLDAAAARLSSLGEPLSSIQASLDEANDALENTATQIDSKNAEIAQTQSDLADKRTVLSGRMRSSYKAGATSDLDYILGATSAEDLVSRIHYMDKVNESDADAISEVQALENQLEQEKGELEATQQTQQEQVDSMTSQVQEYQGRVAEARSYYDQLDQQVQAELAAQAAAAQAAADEGDTSVDSVTTAVAAIETSRQVESTTGSTSVRSAVSTDDAPAGGGSASSSQSTTSKGGSGSSSGSSSSGSSSTSGGSSSSSSSSSGSSSSGGSSSGSSSSSTPGGAYPGAGVASAYSCIGYPYVWGGDSPSDGGFDCSGLVFYCFRGDNARLGGATVIGTAIKAAGLWKDSLDELSYGDCVFTRPDYAHIGIYIGGGQMIHAPSPGRTVCVGKVYAFYGGGPYSC